MPFQLGSAYESSAPLGVLVDSVSLPCRYRGARPPGEERRAGAPTCLAGMFRRKQSQLALVDLCSGLSQCEGLAFAAAALPLESEAPWSEQVQGWTSLLHNAAIESWSPSESLAGPHAPLYASVAVRGRHLLPLHPEADVLRRRTQITALDL